MDGRLIAEAHTRVSLAHKIYMYENAKSIASKEKSWFQKMSQEADMDLEDNEDEISENERSIHVPMITKNIEIENSVKKAFEHIMKTKIGQDETISQKQVQSNLAAATSILAYNDEDYLFDSSITRAEKYNPQRTKVLQHLRSFRGGKTAAHFLEIGCSRGMLQFKLSLMALLNPIPGGY